MTAHKKISSLSELIANPDVAFLTVPEVSRVLGRDARFVRKLIETGDLPAKNLASCVFVTRTALLELTDRTDDARRTRTTPVRESVDA